MSTIDTKNDEPIRPMTAPAKGELWSIGEIARWTKMSPWTVRNRLTCSDGFPVPIRLMGRNSQPRWVAQEVLTWINRQQRRR